jgi:phytoene synthase
MLDYCLEKVAQPGTSCYYSAWSLPRWQRDATFILLAFFREIQEIPLTCREPQVAAAKLAWWYDELHRTVHGQPRHPAAIALNHLLKEVTIPLPALQTTLHHIQQLIMHQHSDLGALNELFAGMRSVYVLLTQYIYGYTDKATLDFASRASQILGRFDAILHSTRLVKHGYIALPQAAATAPSMPGDLFLAARRTWVEDLKSQYANAFHNLPASDRFAQRFTTIMLKLALLSVNRMAKKQYDVTHAELPPIVNCWHAWRTYRFERKHYELSPQGR